MEGSITAEEASKRWKYLKDCYTRYKRESSFPRRPKEFRFSEMMSFLEATDTSDSFSDISEENSYLRPNDKNLDRPRTSTPNKTATHDSSKDDPLGLVHFANLIIEGMENLSNRRCRKLQIKILQLLAEEEEQEKEED
ncbi:uncharacterized protein LOC115244464 isoform X2 [Formica exsecta]|uniref:uncharacterized protein LOC115244464 isoform X2 n=1 Tax=Formica exsecta TaxID=72781 RepID=UPI0011449D01|nr:uncharacterized protein LOC115244464 isoform X2 [Formica exsecta]